MTKNKRLKIFAFCMFFFTSMVLMPKEGLSKTDSYEALVQRNLEFRSQIKELEAKYGDLEKERQVLIDHIKKLQQQKEFLQEKLSLPIKAPQEILDLKNTIENLKKQLEEITTQRDKFKQEYNILENQITRGDESEKYKKENKQLKQTIKMIKGEKKKAMEQAGKAEKELKAKEDNLDAYMEDAFLEQKAAWEKKIENVHTYYKEELAKCEKANCVKEAKNLEKKRRQIGGLVDQAIKDEKEKLRKENENLRKLLEDKERKLDEAIAYVDREKENYKKELRGILDSVTISDDQLKKLKNRAFVAETEAQLLKSRLREQAQLRAKLENDIVSLRNEKVQVQAEAEEYIDEELDYRVDAIKLKEKKSTEDKIQEIEKEAGRELKKALALEREVAQKQIKEYKEETEKALKKVVSIERKMTDEKLRQFKEKSKGERLNMHYNLAVVFDKTGNYKNAEKEYLAALEINPEDAEICYNLGILYDDKLNDNAKAVEFYKKYLSLNPVGSDATNIKQWMLNAEQEARLGIEKK